MVEASAGAAHQPFLGEVDLFISVGSHSLFPDLQESVYFFVCQPKIAEFPVPRGAVEEVTAAVHVVFSAASWLGILSSPSLCACIVFISRISFFLLTVLTRSFVS